MSSGHIIFVEMDCTRLTRWYYDGHLTRDPDNSIFDGVVFRRVLGLSLPKLLLMMYLFVFVT